MIASLRGRLLYIDENSLVVECGGVGLKCTVTRNVFNTIPQIGEEISLHTYMAVREDAMELFGFKDIEELKAFKLIISVNGVGAKIGIALLSEFTSAQLMMHIASEDARALTAASGVGIKLAQRIVLELKDKTGSVSINIGDAVSINTIGKGTAASEAVDGLVALGYSKTDATAAVSKLDASLDSGELIKQALKYLARRF